MTARRMIRAGVSAWLLLRLAGLPTAVAAAESLTPASDRAKDRATAPGAMPIYKPPPVGAPSSTVGGATRGDDGPAPIALLAPSHVGLTTQAQPTLYWYVRRPVGEDLVFTLTAMPRRTAEQRVPLPSGAGTGLHAVRLADHQLHLGAGVQYEWTIEPASPSGRRDEPPIVRAAIRRIDPPAAVTAKLRRAAPSDPVFIYAAAGIWYDALDAISDAIAAHPDQAALCAQRAALLSQVGLSDLQTCPANVPLQDQ